MSTIKIYDKTKNRIDEVFKAIVKETVRNNMEDILANLLKRATYDDKINEIIDRMEFYRNMLKERGVH